MNLKHWTEKLFRKPEDGAGSGEPPAAAGEPAPAVAPVEAPAAPAETPAAGPDLSWIGEDYRGEGGALDVDRFRTDYQNLLAEDTRRREAVADVPEDGEYDFSAPADLDLSSFALPEGMTIELMKDDEAMKPLFGDLGAFLKENNLPRSAGQQVAGLLTKYEAAKFSQAHKAATAEFATLGPNDAARDARVQRVARALETRLPEGQAKFLQSMCHSAEGVKALEALVMAPGSHAPGAAPQPAAVDPLQSRYPSNKPR